MSVASLETSMSSDKRFRNNEAKQAIMIEEMAGYHSPALEFCNVTKRYGSVVAVNNVSILVRRGEFVSLLGPSGSGKTTIQRMIGGFEQPDSGSISILGQQVEALPPYRRDTATVFQGGALFPHKTVFDNVAYGLRMRGVSKADIASRVKRALSIVRLDTYGERLPAQLSGGQKQRVALARALVVEPAIVLFDEPLSALDLSLRLQLRSEIKALHDRLRFTAIYVTHDQSEAMAMSDRIAVVNAGRIEQIDHPSRVFSSPINEFVFRFVGESCSLPAFIEQGDMVVGKRRYSVPCVRSLPSGAATLLFRPKWLKAGTAALGCENRLEGELAFSEYLGDFYRHHFNVGDAVLCVDESGPNQFRPGEVVAIGWHNDDVKVYS